MKMHRLTSSRFPGDSQMSHEYQVILDKKVTQENIILKKSSLAEFCFQVSPISFQKVTLAENGSGFSFAKYFPPANESCLIGNRFSIHPVVQLAFGSKHFRSLNAININWHGMLWHKSKHDKTRIGWQNFFRRILFLMEGITLKPKFPEGIYYIYLQKKY